jgi:hypothetical protein
LAVEKLLKGMAELKGNFKKTVSEKNFQVNAPSRWI